MHEDAALPPLLAVIIKLRYIVHLRINQYTLKSRPRQLSAATSTTRVEQLTHSVVPLVDSLCRYIIARIYNQYVRVRVQ